MFDAVAAIIITMDFMGKGIKNLDRSIDEDEMHFSSACDVLPLGT